MGISSRLAAAMAFCCYCRFMGHSVAVLWISATPGRARPGAGVVVGLSAFLLFFLLLAFL